MAKFVRNTTRAATEITKSFGYTNQPEWQAGYAFVTEDYNEDPEKGLTYAIDPNDNLHLMEFLDRIS